MAVVVVADSNALMSIFRLGINIDSALDEVLPSWDVVVPTPVLDELRRLAATNKDARAALALASKFQAYHAEGKADKVVVSVARNIRGVVFTNDKEVLRRAKDEGVPRLFFKGKAVLALEGMKTELM